MRHAAALALVSLTHLTACFAQPALIERADLAQAYLDVDRAYTDNPPDTPAAVVDANRRMDRAALAFFSGRFAPVIKAITRLASDLRGGASPAEVAAAGLQLRLEPPVAIAPFSEPLRVRLASMFVLERSAPTKLELRLELRDSAGHLIAERDARLTRQSPPAYEAELKLAPATPLAIGTYTVAVMHADRTVHTRLWYVVTESLDRLRAKNAARLDRIKPVDDRIAAAIAIARARNELLSNAPLAARSAEFLADFRELVPALDAEIAALETQRDPYANRSGDYWRVLPFENGVLPFRFAAPESVATQPATPRPLLIAFHGAGGDENMFFDGYGAGRLKSLALKRGWLVATPESTQMLTQPERFQALLASIADDYTVDLQRVYVLGHSLGARAAYEATRQFPERVAAGVLIAGNVPAPPTDAVALPPLLAIVAENDLLARPGRSVAAIERLQSAGAAVTLRRMPDLGHTFVVGAVLEDALAWLAPHTADTSAPR